METIENCGTCLIFFNITTSLRVKCRVEKQNDHLVKRRKTLGSIHVLFKNEMMIHLPNHVFLEMLSLN